MELRAGFPFNYDQELVSFETGLGCLDQSRTKQSFAEESDINTIVKRFGLTGQVPEGVRMPTYGDFDGISDYHEAANAIAAAHEAFDAMPAEVRHRFNYDPGELVAFCSDERNRDEARKLGFLVPEVVPPVVEPLAVRVVEPAPASSSTVVT